MFRLMSKKEPITCPVQFTIAVDGGGVVKKQFTGKFIIVDDEEELKGKTVEELTRENFVGWGEDLQDEDGNPLEYNEENKSRVLRVPMIKASVMSTYMDLVAGNAVIAEAAEKNS